MAPGKAKVYLGLETAADSERAWFAVGEARERALAKMRARGEDPDELEPISGFRRSITDDGTRLHHGLRVPAGTALDAPALAAAMSELAGWYGVEQAQPPARETAAALSLALGTLDQSGDWKGLAPPRLPAPAGRRWSGFTGVEHHPARHHLRRAAARGSPRARLPPPSRSLPGSPPSPASPCTTTSISGRSSSAATDAGSGGSAAAAAARRGLDLRFDQRHLARDQRARSQCGERVRLLQQRRRRESPPRSRRQPAAH